MLPLRSWPAARAWCWSTGSLWETHWRRLHCRCEACLLVNTAVLHSRGCSALEGVLTKPCRSPFRLGDCQHWQGFWGLGWHCPRQVGSISNRLWAQGASTASATLRHVCQLASCACPRLTAQHVEYTCSM